MAFLGSLVRVVGSVAGPAARTVAKAVLPGIITAGARRIERAVTGSGKGKAVGAVNVGDDLGSQVQSWMGQVPQDLAILIAAGAIVYGFFRRQPAAAVAAAPAAAPAHFDLDQAQKAGR